MKPALKYILTAFCILHSTFYIANAQDLLKSEYSFRHYTTQDGLPNLLLETAFQDSRGFLWIATYKGFARFDGIKYRSFFAETNINILKLENGENGDVRAYTYHNVFVVDKNDSVRNINFTPQNIYLNTYNSRDLSNGYLILENETATEKYLVHFENDTVKEILRCAELNEIIDTKPFLDLKTNKLYLPSLSGLNIFDINTHKSVKIKGLTAECFLQHSTLGLLAFDNNGIYQIVGNQAQKLVSCKIDNDKRAVEMTDGSIVMKDKRAAYRFREGNFELINQFNLSVVDLICDSEGNVWVATHDGLYNYFHFDFINSQIEKDVVKFVQEDTRQNIWYGTIYGNLLRGSNGKTDKITFPKTDNKSFLFGSAAIGQTLYFPRDNDILMYENSRFSWANLPYNVEDYDGYSKVLPYGDDKILTMRGIGVYLCQKNGKIIHFYSDEELQQQDFQDIAVDSRGCWFASGHLGISIVDKNSVKLVGGKNSPHTTSLCIDNQDNVWSASGNRLNLLRGDSIVTVRQFTDDPVQAIYTLDNNYLILSTIHCIYFFNKAAFLHSGQCQFIQYDHNNGFMGLNPQVNGIFTDSKGHIYLSCANMLVRFEPNNLLYKPQSPVLHILSAKISSDNVKWTNTENNKFSYRQKNLQFSFIGLSFSAAQNVRYHYRLIGFQNEFSEPTKQREVTFNNLPHGDYTFEIYADAGTDDNRSEIKTFSFTIKPAFWQTAWFLAIALMTLMSLTTLMAMLIMRKKNKLLIAKLETEKQLNELKINAIRLKAIPHFNANVLAAIEYYIMNKSKEDAINVLGIYSQFTFQTLQEVDKASRSLSAEIDYVKMYLDLERLRFGEKFEYEIVIDESVNQNIQLPNMILHTWAENAVKHGLAGKTSGGKITISATLCTGVAGNAPSVLVSVADNGAGRQAAAQNRNVRSTKQGLSILERQVEIYNRFNKQKIKLLVEDLEQGTRFSVEVPENYQYEIQ